MKKLVFIDTNILVQWIMVEGKILDYLINKFNLSAEFKHVYIERYEMSLTLLNNILDQKYTKTIEFSVSTLVTNELFSGIKSELISILKLKEGIPLSKWNDTRNIPEISEEIYKEVYNRILRAFDQLFSKHKLELIEEKNALTIKGYYDIF
ncbi:hypothetical protein ACFL96_17555, partial [Thermoproteota archaeon]